MPVLTTHVSIYCPARELSSAREPLSETWHLARADVPADLQPVMGAEADSPLGYTGERAVQCFFAAGMAEYLASGYLILDAAGECWRVSSPPEIWNAGSAADHITLRAEWMPRPASLEAQ